MTPMASCPGRNAVSTLCPSQYGKTVLVRVVDSCSLGSGVDLGSPCKAVVVGLPGKRAPARSGGSHCTGLRGLERCCLCRARPEPRCSHFGTRSHPTASLRWESASWPCCDVHRLGHSRWPPVGAGGASEWPAHLPAQCGFGLSTCRGRSGGGQHAASGDYHVPARP